MLKALQDLFAAGRMFLRGNLAAVPKLGGALDVLLRLDPTGAQFGWQALRSGLFAG